MYSLGTPYLRMSCARTLGTVFGNAPLMSRNKTRVPCFRHHASLMKLISVCRESVVVQPGHLPNCIWGSSCSLSVWYWILSFMTEAITFVIVSSRAIGLYDPRMV